MRFLQQRNPNMGPQSEFHRMRWLVVVGPLCHQLDLRKVICHKKVWRCSPGSSFYWLCYLPHWWITPPRLGCDWKLPNETQIDRMSMLRLVDRCCRLEWIQFTEHFCAHVWTHGSMSYILVHGQCRNQPQKPAETATTPSDHQRCLPVDSDIVHSKCIIWSSIGFSMKCV